MRIAVWWTALCALGLACGLHFICILLFNMPTNPVIAGREPLLNRYIKPYFQQTWTFFAPAPDNRNYFIVARAQYDGDDHTSGTTRWYNISEILIEPVKRNRFSPLFQVEIGLANAAEDYVNYVGSVPALNHDDNGHSVLNAELPAGLIPVASEYINRTSAATLMKLNPNLHFRELQVGLFVNHFPAFTKRGETYDLSTGSLSTTPWTSFPNVQSF